MYAVVRTDNMEGTSLGKYTASIKVAEAMENGSIVVLGGLVEGERELRTYSAPTGNEKLGKLALVASPEVVKEKKHNALADFTNEKDSIARVYILLSGDMFSLTKEGFAEGATLEKGSIVELAAGNKLNAVKTATSGKTKIGTIFAVEGSYYVVAVD